MDDRRDAVMERLTSAYARGIIDVEEFERRAAEVAGSAVGDDLKRLVADLPRDPEEAPPPPAAGRGTPRAAERAASASFRVNPGPSPARGEIVALFSSSQRVGRWTAPRRLEAIGLFGSCHVDLRDADIPADGMKIEAVGIFGSVGVIVPEGVEVRVSSVAVFGSSGGGDRAGEPGAPVVEIEAVGIFGSAGVVVKPRD